MQDPNQIEVPPSFVALYASPSGHRLTQPMSEVRERYELCEDLAQMLTEHAAMTEARTGAPGREVLLTMQRALEGSESSVRPVEAVWVVRRLAELLGWEWPHDGTSGEPG